MSNTVEPAKALIGVRLDAEDLRILEQICKREKLTKSDIVRRAIRAYAKLKGKSNG